MYANARASNLKNIDEIVNKFGEHTFKKFACHSL
jgi:hypothetical protein